MAFLALLMLTEPDAGIAAHALTTGMIVVIVAAGWRCAILRVLVDENGLAVRNFSWSTWVAWEDVERLEIDRGEHSSSIHAFIVLTNGSRIPVTALQTRFAQPVERARRKGTAARKTAELNRMLATRRGEPLPLPRRLVSWRAVLPVPVAGFVTVLVVFVAMGVMNDPPIILGLAMLAGLLGFLGGVPALPRVRVRADEAGVRLVGLLRSKRVPWAEVAGFDVIRRRPVGWRAVLHHADGTRLPMPGLGSRVTGRRHLDRATAELAAIHADQRPAHVSAAGD